jgi:hypothetical protein
VGCVLRGKPPRRLRAAPLHRGDMVWRGVRPRTARGRRQGLPCPARHCEAPGRLRYARCYRCEAIQCRRDIIRLTYRRRLRQPWIASPHIINYVSQVRWRLRNDGAPGAHHGQGVALPRAGTALPGRGVAPPTRRDGAPRAGRCPAHAYPAPAYPAPAYPAPCAGGRV